MCIGKWNFSYIVWFFFVCSFSFTVLCYCYSPWLTLLFLFLWMPVSYDYRYKKKSSKISFQWMYRFFFSLSLATIPFHIQTLFTNTLSFWTDHNLLFSLLIFLIFILGIRCEKINKTRVFGGKNRIFLYFVCRFRMCNFNIKIISFYLHYTAFNIKWWKLFYSSYFVFSPSLVAY